MIIISLNKTGIFFTTASFISKYWPKYVCHCIKYSMNLKIFIMHFLIIVTCLIFDRKSISQWRGEETHSGITAEPGVGTQWARSHAQRERKGRRGARSSHQTTRAAQEWARISVQSRETVQKHKYVCTIYYNLGIQENIRTILTRA